MKLLIALAGLAHFVLFIPRFAAAGDEDFQRLLRPAEPPPLELIIAVSEVGDSVSFFATNNTGVPIELAPFASDANYLIVRDPSGKVTRRSANRRETYKLVQIGAGETKLMKRAALADFMNGDAARATDNDACWRFLWVVDWGEGGKRTRYTSNVLVLSRQKIAAQKEQPASGQQEDRIKENK